MLKIIWRVTDHVVCLKNCLRKFKFWSCNAFAGVFWLKMNFIASNYYELKNTFSNCSCQGDMFSGTLGNRNCSLVPQKFWGTENSYPSSLKFLMNREHFSKFPKSVLGNILGNILSNFGEYARYNFEIKCWNSICSGDIKLPRTIFCDNFTYERHMFHCFTIKDKKLELWNPVTKRIAPRT